LRGQGHYVLGCAPVYVYVRACILNFVVNMISQEAVMLLAQVLMPHILASKCRKFKVTVGPHIWITALFGLLTQYLIIAHNWIRMNWVKKPKMKIAVGRSAWSSTLHQVNSCLV